MSADVLSSIHNARSKNHRESHHTWYHHPESSHLLSLSSSSSHRHWRRGPTLHCWSTQTSRRRSGRGTGSNNTRIRNSTSNLTPVPTLNSTKLSSEICPLLSFDVPQSCRLFCHCKSFRNAHLAHLSQHIETGYKIFHCPSHIAVKCNPTTKPCCAFSDPRRETTLLLFIEGSLLAAKAKVMAVVPSTRSGGNHLEQIHMFRISQFTTWKCSLFSSSDRMAFQPSTFQDWQLDQATRVIKPQGSGWILFYFNRPSMWNGALYQPVTSELKYVSLTVVDRRAWSNYL